MHGARAINATILRGGTSKGVYLLKNELPADPALRDQVILAIFGSPDQRQIDGLGGADPLTSKLAIVGGSSRPDADVEYTFGQVGIDQAKVFYQSICGNITSGVGPFAINNSLVKAEEGITVVRIYNTNTGKVILANVPVINGKAAFEGDFAMAGVPGTGAKILIDFSQTVGALTGKGPLPTGNPTDRLEVGGVGAIDVSIVDVAACQIYIRAKDVGLTGRETPREVDSDPGLTRKLEAIRAHATWFVGLADTPVSASTERRNTPHLAIIGEGGEYQNHLTGEIVSPDSYDILARMMFMQIMHKTYAGTGSICLAAATQIPGTIPNLSFRGSRGSGLVRIGHPAGIIPIETDISVGNGAIEVRRAAIARTARTIMEGRVYVRESLFNYD
ncbi:MAG: 3-methylitaconate isomerase [Peptococcaceae bacterium]|jgi:2-methylaconitate cis-trans-isomerase PrpF|nr:3-methylitaconate isomerase [Peptococcaceae bacterium]